MNARQIAFTQLIVSLTGGALGGCASADSNPNGDPAVWKRSSSSLVITSTTSSTVFLDDGTYPTVDVARICRRWDGATMNAEQLEFLHGLALVERAPRCGADGSYSSQLLVIDANGSALIYEVDSPLKACTASTPKKQWVLPEGTGRAFPPAGAAECVSCDALNPCMEGTCIAEVCVD
jgi:hypothetical protein